MRNGAFADERTRRSTAPALPQQRRGPPGYPPAAGRVLDSNAPGCGLGINAGRWRSQRGSAHAQGRACQRRARRRLRGIMCRSPGVLIWIKTVRHTPVAPQGGEFSAMPLRGRAASGTCTGREVLVFNPLWQRKARTHVDVPGRYWSARGPRPVRFAQLQRKTSPAPPSRGEPQKAKSWSQVASHAQMESRQQVRSGPEVPPVPSVAALNFSQASPLPSQSCQTAVPVCVECSARHVQGEGHHAVVVV